VDVDSRDFLILQTRELIEKTRREIAEIGSDIKTTRNTVHRSLSLLSRLKSG
jgi:hypothetical protein